jgi:hypothetical protein
MPEEGFLIGLSQLGATFTGFVTIFLVFVRQEERFSPADAFRIRALIYNSLVVVIYALVPLTLSFVVSPSVLWRASAGLSFFAGLPFFFDSLRSHLAMTKEDRRQIVLPHTISSYGLIFVAGALVAALALGYGHGSGFYVVALMLIFLSVLTTFVVLAFKNLF